MWCLCHDQCFNIVIIIWSSINFPTVICLPTVCYFSREKPLVKPTPPGSSFPNQKYKKYLAAFYFYLYYFQSIFESTTNLSHVRLPILSCRYPEGIDNPFNTSGCEVLLFVCRGCLRCVAWFPYWFYNLGFISEGNTYRCCAASSLPLWGNTNVASSRIKHAQTL